MLFGIASLAADLTDEEHAAKEQMCQQVLSFELHFRGLAMHLDAKLSPKLVLHAMEAGVLLDRPRVKRLALHAHDLDQICGTGLFDAFDRARAAVESVCVRSKDPTWSASPENPLGISCEI